MWSTRTRVDDTIKNDEQPVEFIIFPCLQTILAYHVKVEAFGRKREFVTSGNRIEVSKTYNNKTANNRMEL